MARQRFVGHTLIENKWLKKWIMVFRASQMKEGKTRLKDRGKNRTEVGGMFSGREKVVEVVMRYVKYWTKSHGIWAQEYCWR